MLSSLPCHRQYRVWSVVGIFYMRKVEDVSVKEQVYGNFQIPRNCGRTENVQLVCTRPFFPPPMHEQGYTPFI